MTKELPKPSISGDATADGNKVPEGKATKIGQKVANPTEDMGGTVTIDGKPVDNAKVVVDPETGEITVTVPEGTLGDGVSEKPAKVQITDKDGQPVGDPIDAKVTKEISKVVDPEWKNTNLPDDGSRVNVPNTGDEIPHDTDVDLLVGYGEHNKGEQDWTVRLEEDGSITVIPGGDAAPEDSIEVHVELTYADGSTETKTFIVKVPLTFEGFFPENLGSQTIQIVKVPIVRIHRTQRTASSVQSQVRILVTSLQEMSSTKPIVLTQSGTIPIHLRMVLLSPLTTPVMLCRMAPQLNLAGVTDFTTRARKTGMSSWKKTATSPSLQVLMLNTATLSWSRR